MVIFNLLIFKCLRCFAQKLAQIYIFWGAKVIQMGNAIFLVGRTTKRLLYFFFCWHEYWKSQLSNRANTHRHSRTRPHAHTQQAFRNSRSDFAVLFVWQSKSLCLQVQRMSSVLNALRDSFFKLLEVLTHMCTFLKLLRAGDQWHQLPGTILIANDSRMHLLFREVSRYGIIMSPT